MVAKKTVISYLSGKFDEDLLRELSSFIDSRKDSLKMIKVFEKWARPLQEIGIPFSATDFYRCISDDAFLKQNSTLSKTFYQVRYAGFDTEAIWNHCKKKINTKRGNPYNADSVAAKLSVSIEEAEEIVRSRLDKVRIDLPSLIARHGERLGREKYEQLQSKSKTSVENYKERYGDGWKAKWEYFRSTRNTRSLEAFVKKFGEDEGRARFEECNAQYTKKMSLEHLIEKFGEEVGTLEFQRRNSSKDSSSRSATFNRLKKVLGRSPTDQEIEQEYLDKRKKMSRVYQILVSKLPPAEAEIAYAEYKEKKRLSPDIAQELVGKMSMPHPRSLSPCSRQSAEIFKKIEAEIGRSLSYGTKSKELCIYDADLCKLYYYDCFDAESNTILEFNGSAFHPHPDLTEEQRASWYTISGQDANQKQAEDEEKIRFAIKSGYNVQVIWDKEVKLKHDRDTKIKQLAVVLNENKENFKQCQNMVQPRAPGRGRNSRRRTDS